MLVGQCLGEIAPHSVVTVLECVYRKEAHMLKAHGITAVEKYTQPGVGMGLRRLDDYFVLLPF